eukprot:360899-Chlamydomonas_euryale.AAC.3
MFTCTWDTRASTSVLCVSLPRDTCKDISFPHARGWHHPNPVSACHETNHAACVCQSRSCYLSWPLASLWTRDVPSISVVLRVYASSVSMRTIGYPLICPVSLGAVTPASAPISAAGLHDCEERTAQPLRRAVGPRSASPPRDCGQRQVHRALHLVQPAHGARKRKLLLGAAQPRRHVRSRAGARRHWGHAAGR